MKRYLLILAMIIPLQSIAQNATNTQTSILKQFATKLLYKKHYLSYAVNVNPASGVADFDNSLALFADLVDQCK